MCYVCHDPWCEYPGEGCFPEDYPEFQYLTPEGLDLIVNPPAFVSESEYNSMSKKVEVEVEKDADKNGIITKQSEVYVWNDTVFASYKSALAASKKDRIIESFIRHMYPTYTEAQIKSSVITWSANPHSYSVYLDKAVKAVTDLLAE